ncbi:MULTISPECIES: hypothetical protein [unclassified Rhodococcus (in: high G+C Gram-positive bacteria)]|uniref:hypothetical protein n=1 Tax=unclassified Rhodococcus (in: high G+C Gram-positive bacteria) TaxID=192944 RepID=UPI000BDAF1FF|nr:MULTISPECIES: hypothetical protein [unclassified Rhodococcus (in: high G+C Gram-positive bacteria)]MBP1161162.1 hypothetical protein [Rhodococcus sp. PvR099]PTR39556.1 hypothetical protein C8K38_115150 [Rhodococcus sp. OK611]SNX92707.1 hypothetical protein SAMN05447004_115150 [Rhodococcus sp. OK270]
MTGDGTAVDQSQVGAKLARATRLEELHKRQVAVEEPSGARAGDTDAANAPAESDGGSESGEQSERDEDSNSALLAAELRIRTLKAKNREQDIKLRKRLALWSTIFVGAQLLMSNVFFGVYLFVNRENPDSQVMIAWLTASVVEVIGILLVIARSLFPVKNGNGQGSS